MTLNEWPQWVAVFLLILPIVSWPTVRVAMKKPFDSDWFGSYVFIVLSKAGWVYLLIKGGFWS